MAWQILRNFALTQNAMKNSPLRHAPLLHLAVCLAVGIAVNELVPLPFPRLLLFVGSVIAALILWKSPWWQSAAIAVCFFMLGCLLVERHRQSLMVEWLTEAVCYEAVVISEPIEKPKTIAVDILLPSCGRKLKCYLAKDARSKSLRPGDGLRICSVIRPNSDWRIGRFDYRRYLEAHGFTGSTYVPRRNGERADISLKRLSRLERTKILFLKWRGMLLQRLDESGMKEEQYAVVAAMALGDKSALSKNLKEIYAQTGASHVLALSGMHLGILYALFSLFATGRMGKMLSRLLLVPGVWAFVLLVGMPASVVRAAVMVSVHALLSLGDRDRMSVNTLAFTAIMMLAANPYALYDIGFQLSYAAMFAIFVLLPAFDLLVSRKFLVLHPLLKWLWGIGCVSCAAQMGVAPLIAYHFGRFSSYFLLTNLVVVPVVGMILYLSMVVLLVPSLSPLLARVVTLLNTTLGRIALLPHASVEGLRPTALQVALIYAIIVVSYALMQCLFRKTHKVPLG